MFHFHHLRLPNLIKVGVMNPIKLKHLLYMYISISYYIIIEIIMSHYPWCNSQPWIHINIFWTFSQQDWELSHQDRKRCSCCVATDESIRKEEGDHS